MSGDNWVRTIYTASLKTKSNTVFDLQALCDILLCSNEMKGKANGETKEVPAKIITNIYNDEIRIITKNGFEFVLNRENAPGTFAVNIYGDKDTSPSGMLKEDNSDRELCVPNLIPAETSEAKE